MSQFTMSASPSLNVSTKVQASDSNGDCAGTQTQLKQPTSPLIKVPATRVKSIRVKTSVKSGGMQNHNQTLVRAREDCGVASPF